MLWYLIQSCLSLGRLKRLFHFPIKIALGNTIFSNKNNIIKSIATWNLQGLFFFMNPTKTRNIINELKLLNEDILCLQEIFETSLKIKIINELKNKYPYYLLGNIDKKYIIGDDSGLLILSKYKIEFVKELILHDAFFPDRLANKSILYFKVGNLNLITTHLQSSQFKEASNISGEQIKLLMNDCPFNQYIITGDLNHTNPFKYINYHKNNIKTTCGNSILDYIIPINYPNIKLITSVSERSIKNITDHNCLTCKIDYLNK